MFDHTRILFLSTIYLRWQGIMLEPHVEQLLEPRQCLWLHSNDDVESAIAVWARHKVKEVALAVDGPAGKRR